MKKLPGITLITSLLFGMLLAGCAKKEEAPVTEAATEAPTEAPATAAAALKIECGTYVNENQDTVTLTKKSDSTYDVVVSIVRLCQMEGDGHSFWHKKQPAAGMRRAVFI